MKVGETARATAPTMDSAKFRRHLLLLIILAWNLPAVVGFAFILLSGVLTPQQVVVILTTPLEPAYILFWQVFVILFFPRHMRPLTEWLHDKSTGDSALVLRAVRQFPLLYWGLFLLYLVFAAVSVVVAADIYTEFVATPLAFFRIMLVAVIVSIIVGLPIFFLIMDLFGKAMGGLVVKRPIVSIRTKVFLIGALIPLLIDTMLVQYYWTRTGYFTMETFGVWLALELLAIGGSLIFMHSFGQSLSPLQGVIRSAAPLWELQPEKLTPQSTDELGILSSEFRELLQDLQVHNQILEINNEVLRGSAKSLTMENIATTIIEVCHKTIPCDKTFLILYDESSNELVGTAQTGVDYKSDGYYRIALDDVSLSVLAFGQSETISVADASKDLRMHPELSKHYGVKSALATPLQVEGKNLGVLLATTLQHFHEYSRHEIRLFEALARETALALNTQILRQGRREQEEQVTLLLNSTEEGIYGTDTRGVCTFINAASLRMLGYEDKNEVLGKHVHTLFHHSHADGSPYPKDQCKLRLAALKGDSVHATDEVHWRKDGSFFPVEYWSHLVFRDSENIGTVVTFVDITERLRIEEELTSYQENLEELVKGRTAELNAINKELESFSYSVSHDLRAPLRAIDGFSLALLEDYEEKLDDEGRDYLRRVRNGVGRMGLLIDDLLMLARVSRSKLTRTTVNISQLATDIAKNLNEQEPERTVQFNIEPDMKAKGDQQLLAIVIENLLTNAWKYTRNEATGVITVGSKKQTGKPVFFVEDNGAGFDMQYAGKLFSAFQRLHRDEEFEGTGIGLATVQRIIHRHGGSTWAEAEVDKGAIFYFTLMPVEMLEEKISASA